jgi:hypothetical protein
MILKYLPFVSTLITFLFAWAVFSRYSHKRGTHLLMWGIGLVLYGAGTFAEAYLALAWSDAILRLWYITGAMLTAAWLGQGTVYLLVRREKVAHASAAALAVVSIISIMLIAVAKIDGSTFDMHVAISAQYKNLMERSSFVTLLTVLLNIYGTITLVGGAIYSAYLFWRKQVLPHRVIGNILIAVGAMFPAAAGTLIKLGLSDYLYVSELIGATLMFAGFIAATSPQAVKQTQAAAA